MTPSAFDLTVRVPESDIDPQGHVNNVAFLRLVQGLRGRANAGLTTDQIMALTRKT